MCACDNSIMNVSNSWISALAGKIVLLAFAQEECDYNYVTWSWSWLRVDFHELFHASLPITIWPVADNFIGNLTTVDGIYLSWAYLLLSHSSKHFRSVFDDKHSQCWVVNVARSTKNSDIGNGSSVIVCPSFEEINTQLKTTCGAHWIPYESLFRVWSLVHESRHFTDEKKREIHESNLFLVQHCILINKNRPKISSRIWECVLDGCGIVVVFD